MRSDVSISCYFGWMLFFLDQRIDRFFCLLRIFTGVVFEYLSTLMMVSVATGGGASTAQTNSRHNWSHRDQLHQLVDGYLPSDFV